MYYILLILSTMIPLCTVYSTVYSIHTTLYSICYILLFTLYSEHDCEQCTQLCKKFTLLCTEYITLRIMYITVYNVLKEEETHLLQ